MMPAPVAPRILELSSDRTLSRSLRHLLGKSATARIIHKSSHEIRDHLHSRLLSWKRRAVIGEYLRRHPVRKLQLGAGANNLEGWLNTDITPGPGQVYLSMLEPFPLPDCSFHRILTEHGFEHITYEQGQLLLRECHRVLIPGGILRIATPNLLQFLRLFNSSKTAEELRFMRNKIEWHGWPPAATACAILNLQMRSWGHQFLYDPETLRAAIESAGFRNITDFPIGESDVADLRGIESRQRWDEPQAREANAFETMVMQAVKSESQ